ncbi:MAG: hypothetical protein ACHQAY_28140, partial [Hyphomicrobiales bacterium]
ASVLGLERNTSLPAPQMTSDPKSGAPIYTWAVDADGGKDILQIEGFGPSQGRCQAHLRRDCALD